MKSMLSIALLACALSGCESPTTAGEPLDSLPRALSASEQSVIASSNSFAFDLFRSVNGDQGDENVFISPLSVSMALGMTMNGAAGTTRDEMRTTLGFGDLAQPEINAAYRDLIDLLLELDPSVDLGIANSIWYREGFPFDKPFFDTVGNAFDAEVAGMDFMDPASLKRINDWVSEGTKGRIPTILDELRPDAVMFLINAIYFKGAWRDQFEKSATRDAPFTTYDGATKQVKMMSGNPEVRMGWSPDYQVVDLPYGNGAFTMTIVLPKPGGDVNDVVAGMDAADWKALVDGLTEPRESPVSMPRFRLEYEKVLNETLQELGMPTAFSDFADFTGMSSEAGRSLLISEVRHKSFVDVNEEGTEAAAVTSVTIVETSAPQEIRIDRPFVFAIRERFSGTILFMGKIVEP